MTDAPPPAPPAERPETEYEDRELNLRAIVGFGAGLFALAVAVHLLLAWFFFVLLHREENEKQSRFPLSAPERVELPQTKFGSPATGQLPVTPRLEGLNLANPANETGPKRGEATAQARYARDEEELNGYGKPGAARIPIEQAMRLVAEEWKPKGHEAGPVRYDAGVPGTGGGSNSGRDLPEGKR